jgi:hypothetical protein
VLKRSHVFSGFAEGNVPSVSYEIMGYTYAKGYYLADGIYPKWPFFVNTHHEPKEEKYSRFVKEQEACRKDVERAFGVLSLVGLLFGTQLNNGAFSRY